MPEIKIEGNWGSHEEYLKYLVFKDFDKKFGHMSEDEQEKRRQRLEEELPVLYYVDYTDYFICLYELAQEADRRKIPRGYSRGSGAGCLCLYMLGVTQIDSVRWDLDFSRFANKGRKSMADFDWDVSKRRRKEMVEISAELFGRDNVAPICTFNTLSTKVAIRDVGKVLNENENSPYYQQIPYSLRNEVAQMVPTIKTLNDLGEEEEKDVLLKTLLDNNEKLKTVYEKFPKWFDHVMIVEGLPKSLGKHAAGTIIAPFPLRKFCPLCLDKDKEPMLALEMGNAMDDLGLIKMDYLGLLTLDVIDDTLKLAGLTWKDVDINTLDLDDKEVFDKVYKTGETTGVFQMESYEARKMLQNIKADTIEDIIATNAGNRPGTKDNFPDLIKNKLNPENIKVVHEDLKEIYKQSYGVMLYQEQALKLFRYAGFPEETVDVARRSIGHKEVDKMAELEAQLKEGLRNKGWSDSQCDEIWSLLKKQSSYSFNRGHSVAYGLLSYLTAWLKVHYSIYFFSALLTSKVDQIEKIPVIINDCDKYGIKVLPPNVNQSDRYFTPVEQKNKILFGLLAIKGLGESMVNKIIENRPYYSFRDCINKIDDRSAMIVLIKAGAFPSKRSKERLLYAYAQHIFPKKVYKPVKSLPTYSELLIKWNINKDQYLIQGTKNKIDKEKLLGEYNQKRREQFDEKEAKKYRKYMIDFKNKYALNQYMWEFESLNMFLTNDPLKDSYQYITSDWNSTPDNEEVVLLCVLINIKRKKDRNGNQFAYLDLYTPYGIIEATIWARQLKDYSELIKKGECLAMIGRRREGDHFFVSKVKTYEQWKKDITFNGDVKKGNLWNVV